MTVLNIFHISSAFITTFWDTYGPILPLLALHRETIIIRLLNDELNIPFIFSILWLRGSDLCIMSCDCMALWRFGKPRRGPATHHLSIDNVNLCVSLSSSGMGRWLLFDTPPTWMRSCIHQLIRMYLQCVCDCVTAQTDPTLLIRFSAQVL